MKTPNVLDKRKLATARKELAEQAPPLKAWQKRRLDYLVKTGRRAQAQREGLIPSPGKVSK